MSPNSKSSFITILARNKEEKKVLTAILCCVLDTNEPLNSVEKSFTLLPLMLVKGAVGLTKQLHSWIMVFIVLKFLRYMYS